MNIKILAGRIVMESQLSNPSKLQLLNFLQYEATIPQVKAFILDGEIVKLDEQAIEIVNDRFALSEAGGKVAQIRKTYFSAGTPVGALGTAVTSAMTGAKAAGPKGAIAGTAAGVTGLAIWAVYRKIRSKYDQCTKRCGTFELNTARRQFCMAKCKVGKIEQQLQAAIKAKNQTEINKKKVSLAKAKQTFANYQKSFKGKETPN